MTNRSFFRMRSASRVQSPLKLAVGMVTVQAKPSHLEPTILNPGKPSQRVEIAAAQTTRALRRKSRCQHAAPVVPFVRHQEFEQVDREPRHLSQQLQEILVPAEQVPSVGHKVQD